MNDQMRARIRALSAEQWARLAALFCAHRYYWTTVDFPGTRVTDVRVDRHYVSRLPSLEQIAGWIAAAEGTVAGQELDPLLPYGVEYCDARGGGHDGEGAQRAAEAVQHAVCSLLDGGDPPHWVEMSRVEAFLPTGTMPVLTLRLRNGQVEEAER